MTGHNRPLLLVACCAASHARADERFWIPFKTYAADGGARPNSGALRFVSLALHILSHKGERRRRNVSARNVSGPELHLET